ncbi:hypothetical protein B566_EDAN007523 [Ephemera danica]|nr:hypothetical protein B566_EDAN007523 [Ephemera danica]
MIRMGCISSKTDINDLHPNVFNVMNVDDAGTVLSQGQLEVTEADLILYQRGKTPVRWPLKCLRRYGFDADVFSFESGRRCPTGPGIYAFRCTRAEQLFNLLQAHIQQSRSSGGDDTISREFPVATPTSGPPSLLPSSIPRGSLASSGTLVDSPLEPNYLEPVRTSHSIINLRQANGSARLASGPLSPQTPSPISVLPPNSVYYANDIVIEAAESVANNNVRTSLCLTSTADAPPADTVTSGDVSMANTPGTPTTPIGYMNLTSPTSPISPYGQPYDTETNYTRLDALLKSEHLHLYMNVEPEKDKEILELPAVNCERHCYANLGLGLGEMDIKPRTGFVPHPTPPTPISTVETPPAEHRTAVKQVNYIVLDLERGSETVSSAQTTPLSPNGSIGSVSLTESQKTVTPMAQGYATIDFDKTVALSHSVNPNNPNGDAGVRKTRHNSTIHELPVKQNSSSVSD